MEWSAERGGVKNMRMNKEDFDGEAGKSAMCGNTSVAQMCQGVGGKGEMTWSNVMAAPILPEHTATC